MISLLLFQPTLHNVRQDGVGELGSGCFGFLLLFGPFVESEVGFHLLHFISDEIRSDFGREGGALGF